MGKPSSTQPNHSTISASPYVRPHGRRRARSKLARQRDLEAFPEKLSAPSAANGLVSSQPPSPSPLIVSLTSEPEHHSGTDNELPHSDRIQTLVEDDDEEMFYDCEEYGDHEGPSETHKPVLARVQQVIPKPEYDGAAKGRIGAPRNTRPPPSPAVSPPASTAAFGSIKFGQSSNVDRGSTKPAVTPAGLPTVTLAAQQAQKAVPWPTHSRRSPVKKALVVGINYKDMPEEKRLYYAVRDAELWQATLAKQGVAPENIRIITDGTPDGEQPTCENLLNHIRWLVQGAWSGDSLFFAYSGHAVPTQFGASIVTADHRLLYRPVLERELVAPLPAGVDLQVVFDCCHSAGMIGLQYCVGRMAKPILSSDSTLEASKACPAEFEASESDATPPRPTSTYSHAPQHGSLYGIPTTVDTATPPPPPPVTPAMVGQESFGAPPQRQPRGGIVAAPPMTNPTANATVAAAGSQLGPAAGMVSYVRSLVGIGTTQAPTATTAPVQAPAPAATQDSAEAPGAAAVRSAAAPGPRRARQGVVEGIRTPDYFEERPEGYVRTAGKVMVWAGTGESQKAFETYGRAKKGQGVVTKAMCAAFERVSTRRDMWSYLVQEIESENNLRSQRDAAKSPNERPLQCARVQHAELWVSQYDPGVPLRSASPVLDLPTL